MEIQREDVAPYRGPADKYDRDLKFRPIQRVDATDSFKQKHTGCNGNPNVHEQRWAPRTVPCGRNHNPMAGFDAYYPIPDSTSTMTPGDAPKFHFVERTGTGRSRGDQESFTTVAAFESEWTSVQRSSGAERTEQKRLVGSTGTPEMAGDKPDKINHYDGEKTDDADFSGGVVKKQLGMFVAGGAAGMLLHVADHNMHKDDTFKGVVDAVGTAGDGKRGEGCWRASFVGGQAVVNHGSCGGGAAIGGKVAGINAQAPDFLPEVCGDLAAPMADASLLDGGLVGQADYLGAKVATNVTTARAVAGLRGTPLTFGAEGPGAGAGAGAHLSHMGAYAGAHFGELHAGPFAVRAGVKFGMGIENGIPVLHEGPISTPCSIM